jgi:thioredoxin 2
MPVSESLAVCCRCGAVNRLPPARPAIEAKCGACGARLFNQRPEGVDIAMLERQVARGSLPVLVDVWAPWCGPCRAMAPAYEQAARELEPRLRLLKLNSDEERDATARLGIRGIPTMLLFHGGREVDRLSGAVSAGRLVAWVRDRLPPGTV